nr:hypothetical protein [uncultured Halomonas sp.]
MKSNKPRYMDEREKLRKFRELDDAFSQALRDLEGSSKRRQQESDKDARHQFEQRLHELMDDFQQSDDSVRTLLLTLLELGKIS